MAAPELTASQDAPTFEAYKVEVVVDKFPRVITSLCLWGDQVLVGIQDGSLLFFQRNSEVDVGQTGAWQVAKAHRDVERKAILHMVCVLLPLPAPTSSPTHSRSTSAAGAPEQGANSKPLLLNLTEDGVNVRSLPDGMLRYQASSCKGAVAMAWSVSRGQLAVAARRRVMLFELRSRERPGGGTASGVHLEQMLDVTAPDAPLVMAWAGDSLFLGSKKSYHVMLASALPQPTSPTSSLGTPVVTAAPPPPAPVPLQLSLIQAGEVCSVGSAVNACIALSLQGEEVLLARDNQVVCVDCKAHPTRRQPITFSEPLIAMGVGQYHVVALLSSGVEVRSLRRSGAAHVSQRLPALMDSRLVATPGVAPNGSLFLGMAGDKGVRRLMPVSLGDQAEALARAGEYAEALALAALLDEEQDTSDEQGNATEQVTAVAISDRREAVEERLRLMYAHHLFGMGEYDAGMAQLALCSSRLDDRLYILVLLRMLPSLVPAHLRHWLPDTVGGAVLPKVVAPIGEGFSSAASHALPYLTSHRSRTMAAHPELTEARAAWAAQHGGTERPTKLQEAPSGGVAVAPTGGATASEPAAGVAAQAEVVTHDDPGSVPVNGALKDQPHAPVGLPETQDLLAMVDTAMVAAMLAQPEDTGTLLRFVQQSPNWVDLQEGEQQLVSHGRYAELAALYKYHGEHDQALALLHGCSQTPETLVPPATGAAADLRGLPGVWAAVRYLTHLGSDEAALIRKHSGWILGADPEAGLQAFLQMRQPLEPSLALDILHTHSPAYSSMYLEAALQMGVAAPQDYHSELLLIYLQEILDCSDTDSGSTEEETNETLTRRTGFEAAEGTGRLDTAGSLLPPLPGIPAQSRLASPELRQLPLRLRRRAHAVGRLSGADASSEDNGPHGHVRLHASHASETGDVAEQDTSLQPAIPALDINGATGSEVRPEGTGSVVHAVAGVGSPGVCKRRRVRRLPSHEPAGLGPLPNAVPGPVPLFPDAVPPRLHATTGLAARRPAAAGTSVPTGGSLPSSERSPPDSPPSSDTGHPHLALGTAPGTPTPTRTRGGGQSPLAKSPAPAVLGALASESAVVPGPTENLTDVMTSLWEAAPPGQRPAAQQGRRDITKGKSMPGKAMGKAKSGGEAVNMRPGDNGNECGAGQGNHVASVATTATITTTGGAGPQGSAQASTATASVTNAVSAPPPAPPKIRRRPLYQRLRELVFSSPYLDPEHVLSKLPPGELPEIRALMLERLGRHLESLRLYCHVLEDVGLGQAYCDRVYAAECKARRGGSDSNGAGDALPSYLSGSCTPCEPLAEPQDIYLLLLQVVLESSAFQVGFQAACHPAQAPLPKAPDNHCQDPAANHGGAAAAREDCSTLAGAPQVWRQVVWALGRKVSRLDVQRVLAAVPPELPLAWLLPLLEGALAWATETQRMNAITRQLRRSENLAVREAVGAERSLRLLLTAERACAICYRRIGLAAFVAYPDLSLAHYQCHKRKHPHDLTCVLQPLSAIHQALPLGPAIFAGQQMQQHLVNGNGPGPGGGGGAEVIPPLPVSLSAGAQDPATEPTGGALPLTRLTPAVRSSRGESSVPGGAAVVPGYQDTYAGLGQRGMASEAGRGMGRRIPTQGETIQSGATGVKLAVPPSLLM